MTYSPFGDLKNCICSVSQLYETAVPLEVKITSPEPQISLLVTSEEAVTVGLVLTVIVIKIQKQ